MLKRNILLPLARQNRCMGRLIATRMLRNNIKQSLGSSKLEKTKQNKNTEQHQRFQLLITRNTISQSYTLDASRGRYDVMMPATHIA